MSVLHQYNTRTCKGDFQDALASFEQSITNSINSVKEEVSSIKSDISLVKADLKDEINNLKDVIIKRLQDENEALRNRCCKLEQRIIEFESSTNNLEQYGRRNNIVISGIPDSVDTNTLEDSVTEILSDIGVNVTSSDIEACHRIGKKDKRINSSKTIIRFVNRKHAKGALFNKKKLKQNRKNYSFNPKNNPFFISENLTRMNEQLAYQGRKLKRNNLVHACYTRDGIVTIKINDHSKAIKIHHMKDLWDLFPNFDFDDEPFHDASPDVSAQSEY